MPDFVFYGDTERSPAMRHELPVTIGDAFLLAIVDGRLHLSISSLESGRVAAAMPDAVQHDFFDLGFLELREQGLSMHEADLELASRAAAAMGLREAIADPDMPVAIADRLRADGLSAAPRLRGRGRPAAGEVARGTFGNPPRTDRGRGRPGRRGRRAPRGRARRRPADGRRRAADRRGGARGAPRRLPRQRRTCAGRRDRRLGLAGVRPRAGLRPAARRPADRDRPLAAGR